MIFFPKAEHLEIVVNFINTLSRTGVLRNQLMAPVSEIYEERING